MAFTVVFTGNLYNDKIDHDCTEENCPDCLLIETAKSFCKTLKTAYYLAYLNSKLTFKDKTYEIETEYKTCYNSPIALKDRIIS